MKFNYEQLLILSAPIQAVIKTRSIRFIYEEPGEEVLIQHNLLYESTLTLSPETHHNIKLFQIIVRRILIGYMTNYRQHDIVFGILLNNYSY